MCLKLDLKEQGIEGVVKMTDAPEVDILLEEGEIRVGKNCNSPKQIDMDIEEMKKSDLVNLENGANNSKRSECYL